MVFIYILELEQEKYYIGKTNNSNYNLKLNYNNEIEWTKVYKPIKIIEIIPNCDDYDEDKYTRIYMDKYGINNVRGGSFISIELDKPTIDYLNKKNTNESYDYNTYIQEFDTIDKIDQEILKINKLTFLIRNYNNDFLKYIEINPKLKVEINPELYSNIKNYNQEIISSINSLYFSYTRNYNPKIVYEKNSSYYNYTNDLSFDIFSKLNSNLLLNNNNTELLKLKINVIYIHRRKFEIKYHELLPPEYAEIFKNNNYENIFELVKDKLLSILELLYEKQADLISKI